MAKPTIETRLCPHCANSIGTDALTCPYCKADLVVPSGPQWPDRELVDPPKPRAEKLTVKSKAILALGLIVFAVGVYLVGRDVKRHDFTDMIAEQQKLLQEKDQRIKSLQTALAELQKKAQNDPAVEALKTRLAETQKNLNAAQRKLASAAKEIERLSAARVAAARPANRPAETAGQQSSGAARPVPAIQPRTYEAVRTTSVYEEPVNSARVVAKLTKGTQITVVGSEKGWLEIRSKHGNPPGFIRADDAMFISRAN